MDDKVIKHFGVLGMKWGRRSRVASKLSNIGTTATKIVNSKTFKDNVWDKDGWGPLKKEAILKDVKAGKAIVSKIVNSKAFKDNVWDKDGWGPLKKEAILKDIESGKAIVKKVVTKMERATVRSQYKDINTFKKAVAEFDAAEKQKPLHPRDQKIRDEFKTAIKDLEDEITSLYTPDEIKKYMAD